MARKIVVTSGKGGVGKTTVAVQLAAQLSKRGQRVVLCDADFGLNNVDVATGVENLITYDVVDVIEGRCRAKQALVRHPEFSNLYILTSSHSAPERYVSPQALKLVLEALAPQFDFILIDCPAGIDEGFHRAVAAANEAIVVTTPQLTALRDADKVITLLKSYRLENVQIVVNKVRGDMLASGRILSPLEIENLLKTDVLATIPDEYAFSADGLYKVHAPFKVLGNNLLSGKKKTYDLTRKYRGFLGGIRRAIKRNV